MLTYLLSIFQARKLHPVMTFLVMFVQCLVPINGGRGVDQTIKSFAGYSCNVPHPD